MASAFTCCPPGQPGFSGGEDTLGWNMINQIARFHELWVLTQTQNRSSIESYSKYETAIASNIHFLYVALPNWMNLLLKFQGSHQFYYFLWQIKAYFSARTFHKKFKFELFHHVTYANDWMASYIGALIPINYVRGPGGGAHRTPKPFLKQYDIKGRIWERIRSIGQYIFRHDPLFMLGQKRAQAILVCNKEAYDALPKRWSHKAHMFAVCGVSSDDLSINLPSKDSGPIFRVLSAGKLLRIKGFDLAIRSFAEFTKQYPNSELILTGDGPDLQYLQKLALKLNISELVRFERWMPRGDLLNLMAGSDVFLFCSLRDGGGAVVVEAMSMSTPVVCLDISGPSMHVDEASGIKVFAGSPEQAIIDISRALERLYLDVNLRVNMGRSARERTESHYHWDRVGDRLQDIYMEINGLAID